MPILYAACRAHLATPMAKATPQTTGPHLTTPDYILRAVASERAMACKVFIRRSHRTTGLAAQWRPSCMRAWPRRARRANAGRNFVGQNDLARLSPTSVATAHPWACASPRAWPKSENNLF